MAHIFVFGASIAYGVGGENGGWADIIKRSLHKEMYGQGTLEEKHELYNFAKPGATTAFVVETFQDHIKTYKRDDNDKIAILAIGTNDTKAVDSPDSYISTIEKFEEEVRYLLTSLLKEINQVIVLGIKPFDETKTMPKPNPLTGGKSYFSNNRRAIFDSKLKELCTEYGVTFVPNTVTDKEWITTCLSTDGLHPNDKGHKSIADSVISRIDI